MAVHIYMPLAQAVTVTTSVSTCEERANERFAGGIIEVPTGSSITTLTFHHATVTGGTYYPLYDSDGNAVTMTVVAGRSYIQPAALNQASHLKAVGNAAGTINWQGKTL